MPRRKGSKAKSVTNGSSSNGCAGIEADESKFEFELNSEVLCFHGTVLYEAKTIRREIGSDNITEQYYVHFKGWSKRWDDWVTSDRVLKKNTRNIQKMKASVDEAKQMAKESKNRKKKDVSKNADISLEESNTKITIPKEYRLSLALSLRQNLFEQWQTLFKNNLNQNKRNTVGRIELIELPKKEGYTIDNILESVRIELENKWNKQSNNSNNIPIDVKCQHLNETLAGLKIYLESMIERLLFSTELEQWSVVKSNHPNLKISQICGAEHLVRLLHKMPFILESTAGLDSDHIAILRQNVKYVSQFLNRNANKYLEHWKQNNLIYE